MVDHTNHIWSVSNLQSDFIVSWLIVPATFGVPVVYNGILLCYDKVSRLFPDFLFMVDCTK